MIEKVIIMGAAGRDFHNFNVYFRDNPRYRVIAFTAAQIPDIEGRLYPPQLSGRAYPQGIPIYPEENLAGLIEEHGIDLVAFSYSDVSYQDVMHKSAIVTAKGADFMLPGTTCTMLRSSRTVVAVCAVRTGCGKSQTTRKVCEILQGLGRKVVVVRHPMPYGDLRRQVMQRFSSFSDFDDQQCTIEEREEYESLVEKGIVVYAGIDYARILKEAEREGEIIVWDGGNNDTPFFHPDIHIVLFDPHRAGHELLYYPGEANMLMADIAIINKVDSSPRGKVEKVRRNIELHAPEAKIIMAESPVFVSRPDMIQGKKVLVVEDGPTLTHGDMASGAGMSAAIKYEAAEVVDPRPFATGTIRDVFRRYPHIEAVLPAMGYHRRQIEDLGLTINNAECDLVLFATPIHLPRILSLRKPSLRVRYDYTDHGSPTLEEVLIRHLVELSGHG